MHLRKATIDDAKFMLDMRNDEVTRKNSFNQDIISYDSHVEWVKRKLSDDDCLMLVLMDSDEKIGSIRLDIAGDNSEIGEISYMIDPDKRGRGYGKAILELIETYANEEADNLKLKTLVGFVKNDNAGSARCFEDNGYTRLVAGDILCYMKVID